MCNCIGLTVKWAIMEINLCKLTLLPQALVCNCLAASPTFLGLCVGIAVGENTNANPWIFAIAAGMFLYIALVDMIPELNALGEDLIRSGVRHALAYAIMHAGMISGFLLMLIMAIFGNDIDI